MMSFRNHLKTYSLWDSIGLTLDPEVLLDGHPLTLKVKQFVQVLYPTPVKLPVRVARLKEDTHSWCGPRHRHRLVFGEHTLVESSSATLTALLTLFLDPREVFQKQILGYVTGAFRHPTRFQFVKLKESHMSLVRNLLAGGLVRGAEPSFGEPRHIADDHWTTVHEDCTGDSYVPM